MRSFRCDYPLRRFFLWERPFVKILHTADWQIGMNAKHVGARGPDVRAQRLASARALAKIAREHAVDAVFIAGDVFEDNAVDRADVQAVADICASFRVPTYVLPGNHDPLGMGSVWEHGSWNASASVHVLRTSEPLEMAPGVMLYPCPATAKMSSDDPTAWIANASFDGTRIGLAHGTVIGANVAEDCFPIRPDAATASGLDYVALGHFHSTATYEGDLTSAKMAYSGTHETTKFGERDSGNVLVVEIGGRGEQPRLTRVATTQLIWHELAYELAASIDIERTILPDIEAIADPQQSLLKIKLTGMVEPTQLAAIEALKDRINARFSIFAKIEDAGLVLAPEDDAWERALPVGLLADVAKYIRAGTSAHATSALMKLYRYGRDANEVRA